MRDTNAIASKLLGLVLLGTFPTKGLTKSLFKSVKTDPLGSMEVVQQSDGQWYVVDGQTYQTINGPYASRDEAEADKQAMSAMHDDGKSFGKGTDADYDAYAADMRSQGVSPMSKDDWLALSEEERPTGYNKSQKGQAQMETQGDAVVITVDGQVVAGPFYTSEEIEAAMSQAQGKGLNDTPWHDMSYGDSVYNQGNAAIAVIAAYGLYQALRAGYNWLRGNGKSLKGGWMGITDFHVAEDNGQWYVVDDRGNAMDGPFSSQQQAQAQIDKLESNFNSRGVYPWADPV